MATIQRRKNGRWSLAIYDPVLKHKRHIGTYTYRQQAVDAAYELEGLKLTTRPCAGCGREFSAPPGQDRCRYRCGMRNNEDVPVLNTDHWVYFASDADGRLLYIGLTSTGLQRHKEHARMASWWKDVANLRIEHYPTRDDAAKAEAKAIRKHKPPYNKALLPGRRTRKEET